MTKLQELIKVHNEVGSAPIEKSQGTFVYRGRTYTK